MSFPSPSTLHYEGTYEGRPISGQVALWSIPNSPEDAARLLYVVITGRTLRARPDFEWSCGDRDFSARRMGKVSRPVPFLRFTFHIEATPNKAIPRAVAHITFNPPTECDEVAASMSDKAPTFATFDEASQWVRARMPGESTTIIDNTAESLMASQSQPKAPTPAPTFADEIPEPAFDILSELSGNGARSVIIYRAPYMDSVDYVSSPLDPMARGFPKIPGDVVAWQLFETLNGWRWWKTGEFKRHDSAGLFLP